MSAYGLRPLLRDLINRIRSDINSSLDNDPLRRSDAEVYSRAYAGAAHGLHGHLEYLERNLLPDLCDEDWLYRHGKMKTCPRKEPTPAHGWARFTGVAAGISVPAGRVLVYQGATPIEYVVTETATAVDGILRVPITCSTTGYVTNRDDGEALILSEPVPGLASGSHADTLQGGADLEDLEVWRSRVVERWYYTPQGGADADYVVWSKEVAGVTRAWCYRNWMGPGTVGVFVCDDGSPDIIPSQTVLKAVRDHIEPLAPVAGSELYVLGVNLRKVAHRIRVTPTTPVVRAAVTAALLDFYRREGGPEETIEISRLSESISSANGEYRHELLVPNAPFTLNKGEIATVGTITWD
ncbi:baseplate J/gp47 family protein [Aeromonas salmonicida]|uniref:baseplate J/gp47 family protein n=1 Tax=Aeromonas salmonicida TaxID=645 RepID=UPI00259FD257|nr:baseplate J/gp47 family protein [Aeromonas salmonicida]MDM5067318.1 baseplate J/gp47 family protein [Aeromonas salmonicida]